MCIHLIILLNRKLGYDTFGGMSVWLRLNLLIASMFVIFGNYKPTFLEMTIIFAHKLGEHRIVEVLVMIEVLIECWMYTDGKTNWKAIPYYINNNNKQMEKQ